MAFDFDLLIQAIRDGNVVPIIGSELYVDANGVSYEDMVAKRLWTELKLDPTKQPAAASPRDVALVYLINGGGLPGLKAAYRRVIQQTITEPPPALVQLAEITDFKLYVTTAIDTMMEKALVSAFRIRAEDTSDISTTYSPDEPNLSLPDISKTLRPQVCHLLGNVEKAFPLGDADMIEYLQALLNQKYRPENLYDQLRNRNLLFMGCGFPDWLSRLFIRTVKDKPYVTSQIESRAQFIADARAANDSNLSLFLTHYNLQLHPPGSTTAFVAHLNTLWKGVAKPKPARLSSEKAVAKMDCVFLSFSSEDREDVRAIGEALKANGIEIWFDETGIEPGADWNRMIEENLVRAALFVPFVSKKTEELAETPHYFWREWNLADKRAEFFAKGTKFILPTFLDEIDPYKARVPDSFKVPHWFALHERKATEKFIEFIRTEYRRKQARTTQ